MKGSDFIREHPSDEWIAAYVDGRLSPTERDGLEGHLASCHDCRLVAMEAAEVLRGGGGRRFAVAGLGAVAAAAAIAFLFIGPLSEKAPDEPVLRAPAGDVGMPIIEAVSPANGASVRSTLVLFIWRSLGPDIRYQFSLSAVDGSELWGGSVTDTVLTLPPSVELAPGETYVWYVDALMPDGTSATTGLRRVKIEP